jgi:hypothetical protein
MIFTQRLFTLLLGVLFASVLTDQASALYDPGVGRFCSRDPIGYEDGANLFSNYFGVRDSDPTGKDRCIATVTGDSDGGGPALMHAVIVIQKCDSNGKPIGWVTFQMGPASDFGMGWFAGFCSSYAKVVAISGIGVGWVDVVRNDYDELPEKFDCPTKIKSSCDQDHRLIEQIDKERMEGPIYFNGIVSNCHCYALRNIKDHSDYSECMMKKMAEGGCSGSNIRLCDRECMAKLKSVKKLALS